MTTEQVRDYLEKQLFIENTVVTYRLLSRELGIHVNDARLELQKYRSLRKDVHATYVMIGTPPSRYGFDSDPFMEIDEEAARRWAENTGGEAVQERLMLLVSEDELEDSKSQFYIIDSIDVYSLSAVYLIDADLVCKENDRIRELDAQDKTGELAKKVGLIVGHHVKKRKPVKRGLKGKGKLGATATTSKQPTVKKDATVKKDSTIKAEPTKTSKELTKEKTSIPIEKKPTKAGTLDWSKAKSKAEKEKEKADELKARAEKEAREAREKREKDKENPKPNQAEEKPAEAVKRGVKRKTRAIELSDSEQSVKPPSPEPHKGAWLKGRVVVSDDEESDEPRPRKGKGRASAQSTDVEELGRSVRAMMDIDDEEVERVTKATAAALTKPIPKSKSKVVESSDEEEHAERKDEEDSMYVDDEPAEAKPKRSRKKAEKKVVPVGSNGLKKKRVVKSKMSTDERGYIVTEDYSSYESVDEEEPEEPEKPKKKLTSKPSESKLKRTASSKATKAPSKEVKKRASMGGSSTKPSAGQGSLMNFFGKKS
ncbi:DNA polymerase subunit Cdc27 [Thelephora terrestris]|uniref:DNA polymerase delta subunit 3 n=1 Tax=Thelephora terrestris TaxID=56493 RepID=A0A9P6LAT2_9AGAM|nr:DNA polymerase subunit Cdc27 [Thelephora terrestris]